MVLLELMAVMDVVEAIFAFSIADLGLTPSERVFAGLLNLWALMWANGLEHAIAYNQSTGGTSFEALGFGLHEVDVLQETAYHLLAVLAGVPFVAVLGASFAGRMLFQAPINLTTTGTFWEEGAYFSIWGTRVRKPWAQMTGRIEQMTLGVILLTCSLTAYFIA
jgi:hypothetical protein